MTRVVNQISAFLEHKPGTLADFCSILQNAGVTMKAFFLVKASDFGVVRVIVDKLDVAQEALKAAGQVFSITPVIVAEIDDEKKSNYLFLSILKNANINIKYCYAATRSSDCKASMVFCVDQDEIDKTLELLNQ